MNPRDLFQVGASHQLIMAPGRIPHFFGKTQQCLHLLSDVIGTALGSDDEKPAEPCHVVDLQGRRGESNWHIQVHAEQKAMLPPAASQTAVPQHMHGRADVQLTAQMTRHGTVYRRCVQHLALKAGRASVAKEKERRTVARAHLVGVAAGAVGHLALQRLALGRSARCDHVVTLKMN